MPAWNIDTKVTFAPMITIGSHTVNVKPNWLILINDVEYPIVKEAACSYSEIIREHCRVFTTSPRYEVKFNVDGDHSQDLASLFQWKPIDVGPDNFAFLQKVAEELQIPFLKGILSVYEYMDVTADKALTASCPDLEYMEKLSNEIFSETRKPAGLIQTADPEKLSRLLLNYCIARPHRIEEVIEYVAGREDLYPTFCKFILTKYALGSEFEQELTFIMEKLLSNNRLKFADLAKLNLSFNLIQYADKKQYEKTLEDANKKYNGQLENINKLKAKDWELQRSLAGGGINPAEIAVAIRKDDLKTFKLLCKNPNDVIYPSPYERCSFINSKPRTLLEYAAFFGSLKCFSYLQLNNAKMSGNMYQFAICGGNSQILNICEKYHTPFADTLRAAIVYHRPDICEAYFVNDEYILQKSIEFYQTQVFLNFVKENESISHLLFEVCKQDNTGFLEILLRCADRDLNARQELTQKHTLQVCAENASFGCLKILSLEEGIDLHAKNHTDNDNTLLHYACQKGDIRTVELLFQSPFLGDINETNIYGMTPLHSASSAGQTEIVKLLLGKEKCNRQVTTTNGMTPLHLACQGGHAETVATLIKEGFDINAKAFLNNNPLYFAVKSGSRETVVLLLKRKELDINARCENGDTALHVAAASGDKKMVKLLLKKKGIDKNIRNRDALTPAKVTKSKDISELINNAEPPQA